MNTERIRPDHPDYRLPAKEGALTCCAQTGDYVCALAEYHDGSHAAYTMPVGKVGLPDIVAQWSDDDSPDENDRYYSRQALGAESCPHCSPGQDLYAPSEDPPCAYCSGSGQVHSSGLRSDVNSVDDLRERVTIAILSGPWVECDGEKSKNAAIARWVVQLADAVVAELRGDIDK